MISIDDPALPGLAGLDASALRRITGEKDVALIRFRYRAGKRAILHVTSASGEGAIWFFEGDKSRRLSRRDITHLQYDAPSRALYEPFPYDHRMPQIRAFLGDYARVAPALVDGRPAGEPELLRYRPGLSCTFRCRRVRGAPAYVKLINGDNPVRLAEMNRQMQAALAGSGLSVANVIGTAPDHDAIAYAQATGRPLDVVLATDRDPAALVSAIGALHALWGLKLTPARHLTADVLWERAAESAALTRFTVPDAAGGVARILARLESQAPRLAARPIHGDMKLEHLFISRGRTQLIDTESVSLGPPDYDVAQLFGRLWQAELEGRLPRSLVQRAAGMVRAHASDTFDWCLDVVALRLARFYAQRPGADAAAKIEGILDRLK